MEKSNFDQLLKKYITGQVTESERVKIEAWLDVMKTENSKDLELNPADAERLFQKIVSKKDNLEQIKSFKPSSGKETKTLGAGSLLKIAASIILLIVAGYFSYLMIGKKDNFNFLASDKVEKIILNDGTLVWLQKNSRLTYLDKLSQGIRYTELEGEALFEVAKDATHPFHIKCNGAMIKVLGTSFSLKTSDHVVEVKVLTGKVNFSTASNIAGIDVEPNQKAVLKPNGALEKSAMVQGEITSITNDTDYLMKFADAPLSEVLNSIERKFDVTIKKSSNAAVNCKITADLTDQSLERSLETIEEILNVKFEQNGQVITVTGAGCSTP
ncbi:MAG TPA: FecR family protein [Ohtaekwangia sp.]|uniref:FecR family protein n=1 Tax=Ohtaekwangia sp. TaxID=2066019 RepID=UPI002F938441